MYAKVIVDIASSAIDKIFDYRLEEDYPLGSRVLVPFGPRKINGFICAKSEDTELDKTKVKSVICMLDPMPVITEEQFKIAEFLKNRFHIGLADSIRLFLPPELRADKVKDVFVSFVNLIDIEKAKEFKLTLRKNATAMQKAIDFFILNNREHKESEEGDPYWGYGLRTLASSCGLGINEQYRYVYTKLSHDKPIDWTFEREWRLPVKDNHWGVPGLPFLLDRSIYNNPIKDAFVIVETDEEKDIILEQLANMYNSKATNYGYEYDLEMLLRIGVISIEELSKHDSFTQIKIDDITKTHFSKLKLKDVNDDVYSNIDKALEIAGSVFDTEYEKQLVNYGGDTYFYPISHMKLCTDDYTEITQGMMNKGIACCFGEGRYYIEINRPFTGNESFGYDVMRVVADAISDFLGQKFYAFAIPD